MSEENLGLNKKKISLSQTIQVSLSEILNPSQKLCTAAEFDLLAACRGGGRKTVSLPQQKSIKYYLFFFLKSSVSQLRL